MINVPRICLILRYWMQAVWLWSRQLRIQQPTATGNYAAIGRFWSVPYRSSRSTKAQWSGRRLGDKVKIAGRKWIGRVENKREPPYVPPVVLTTLLYCTVLYWLSQQIWNSHWTKQIELPSITVSSCGTNEVNSEIHIFLPPAFTSCPRTPINIE